MNQIALIDESGNYTFDQLQKIAKVLTFQTQQHYYKYWGKTGEVVAYQHEEDAPQAAWRCRIVNQMDEKDKGLNGFHLTEIRNGVTYPYLKVLYHGKETERTISHEILETWEDPYVNNFMLVKALDAKRQSIEILVEISDPVQNSDFGYEIDGVLVSNFFLPSFYNLIHVPGTKYDYMGWIEKPRQLLDGGYISFKDAKGVWWQAFNRQNQLIFKKLGDNQADLTAQEQGRILELIVIAIIKLHKYSKEKQ